jgi:hypothetical protein
MLITPLDPWVAEGKIVSIHAHVERDLASIRGGMEKQQQRMVAAMEKWAGIH